MSTVEYDVGLRLSPELAGTLMTPEEFDAVDDWDEDFLYELIHGVLIVAPPVSEGERGPNDLLGHWLLAYQESHPQGSALDLTLPENYVRTPDSRRRADRVIWCGLGRMPNARRDTPTIAVEFVAAGKRDRQRDYEEKAREYPAAGIEEYWIIDRFRHTMTVVRRDGTQIVVEDDEIYRTPLLPGFELPLKRLFQFTDALVQSGETANDE